MADKAGEPPLPPLWRLLTEAGAAIPLGLSPWHGPVNCQADGKGWPVLVLPGFMTDDLSTALLRRSLDRAGFHSYGWEQGFNLGFRPGLVEALEQRLDSIAGREGRKVILLGWSLGGIVARALGNRLPEKIALIVSLGSPFSGDRHRNRAWRLYNLVNEHSVDEVPEGLDFLTKPPVPTIAVWSASDGIVAPAAARGLGSESDLQIELDVTHFGYGGTADGVRQVVEMLAANLPADETAGIAV
ncbi:alpha/beta hydrolase [Altererythrobacter sp. CC-YST694]|uniref:esterase/lipase family protein n=1 Tax=Altererythrobacter sp. CC-YST694 TaxID=2755038 RepID=UPI001D01422F|nr:alpha/beta hydrolase [Altererythrobacter sp. CC-YST694]MCB5424605.1 alpha/beta hydrolase [Altererythrobacter sp. CC-YST694]